MHCMAQIHPSAQSNTTVGFNSSLDSSCSFIVIDDTGSTESDDGHRLRCCSKIIDNCVDAIWTLTSVDLVLSVQCISSEDCLCRQETLRNDGVMVVNCFDTL